MSDSLLDVFNEMHRLKNENELLRREFSEQAVRIDELLVELGEKRLIRGAYAYSELKRTHAMVDVLLHREEVIVLSREKRARLMADRLARELLLAPPGIARVVDEGPTLDIRTTFYLLRVPGSKAAL